MVATRETTLSITPRAIFSRGSPRPIRLMTSLSANTVHMLLILVGSPERARSAICCWEMPRRSAMISKKRPVPAAHLSFMANLATPSSQKLNDLGVLTAHVDHGAVVAKQAHGTGAVAGNLGHDLVRIGHGDTAVAGRDHAHVVGSHVIASSGKLAAQTLGHQPRRTRLAARTSTPPNLPDRPQRRVSRRRPDIDPDPYHGPLPI